MLIKKMRPAGQCPAGRIAFLQNSGRFKPLSDMLLSA